MQFETAEPGVAAGTNKTKQVQLKLGHLSSGHERSSNGFVARRDCWYLHQKGYEGHDLREARTTVRCIDG